MHILIAFTVAHALEKRPV